MAFPRRSFADCAGDFHLLTDKQIDDLKYICEMIHSVHSMQLQTEGFLGPKIVYVHQPKEIRDAAKRLLKEINDQEK